MASSSSTTKSFFTSGLLMMGIIFWGPRCSRLQYRCWNPRCFLVEHFTNLSDQNVFGERLVEQVHAFFEDAVAGDETVGVARHVKHFHVRALGVEVIGQGAAVHARHYDVGEQQMNGAIKTLGYLRGFFTVGGDQDAEAVLEQEGASQFS